MERILTCFTLWECEKLLSSFESVNFSVFTWQELQSVRGQLASEQSRCFKLEVHAQSLECLCPFSSQSFNLLLHYFVIRSCFCQRKTVSKVTRELSLFAQYYKECFNSYI